MKLTFFCGRTDFIFSNSKKMVYGIYYLLSYTWQSVGFLLHVIHYGCFFCPCVAEFSLNDCTLGELNFHLLCVSVDAGRTLSLYLFKLALPGCCHAADMKEKNPFTQQKHAHNPHFAPLNSSVLLLTIVTFLVLNHSPLLPSLLHDVQVFSVC